MIFSALAVTDFSGFDDSVLVVVVTVLFFVVVDSVISGKDDSILVLVTKRDSDLFAFSFGIAEPVAVCVLVCSTI